MTIPIDDTNEWLETDGLGGYATGTVTGRRTRRYHSILTTSTPRGRVVLVNGLEVSGEDDAGRFSLSSQRYAPDTVHPDGAERIVAFANDPWPTWTYRLPGGGKLNQEVFVRRGVPAAVVCLRTVGRTSGPVRLSVSPLLSGRDHHALQVRNDVFRFDAEVRGERTVFRPYDGVPEITVLSSGEYRPGRQWYVNFLYEAERDRGLPHVEDLASPGSWSFDLAGGPAVLVFLAGDGEETEAVASLGAIGAYRKLRDAERSRRRRLGDPLRRSAVDFLVTRDDRASLIAGYPWFTDWGRDTFIALRGLCLATGRLEDARKVLLGWARGLDRGMLPNRFPENGSGPEFNTVDAALWFVLAASEFLDATRGRRGKPSRAERERLRETIGRVLAHHRDGTRHGIRADEDGLLAGGEPGTQLTWMDVKIDDEPLTPRIGKPVEVQALWLNALRAGGEEWREAFERARASFAEKFWYEEGGYLYDVVDVDHEPGRVDATFRPNQILAAGGLPYRPLDAERARRVVDAVEGRLLTPLGLRTLAPDSPGYAPRYRGGPVDRDRAYHQGTAWPWLLGPFVAAWLSVRGDTEAARREAERRFLAPLRQHLASRGIGHVSEIAEGEAPHEAAGCPFQAWSLGEYLRLESLLRI
jgi:predicted glycogen debranching enzyme